MNPWVALIAAGLCEIGWPLGFKVAQTAPAWRMAAISLSVASMALSGWLLFLAQKQIPMGTAILGVAVFGDALNWGRALGVAMIIGGVVVLKAMTP